MTERSGGGRSKRYCFGSGGRRKPPLGRGGSCDLFPCFVGGDLSVTHMSYNPEKRTRQEVGEELYKYAPTKNPPSKEVRMSKTLETRKEELELVGIPLRASSRVFGHWQHYGGYRTC